MKRPKKINKYCPFCKKHTEQEVSIAKKRDRGSLKKGSLPRLEKRGSGTRGIGNHGKYSRKAKSAWKMSGAKTSKKPDLRYKCKLCGKTSVQNKGTRSKKIEIK